MTFIHARKTAHAGFDGAMISIEDQDRSLWDKAAISTATKMVQTALALRLLGPYQIQAAIQAVRSEADSFAQTGWAEILGLYKTLMKFDGSAVVRLNWCVALSFVKGPKVALVESAKLDDELACYQSYHAARAAFFEAAGEYGEAVRSYQKAIDLSENSSAASFLIPKQCEAKKRPSNCSAFSPTGR